MAIPSANVEKVWRDGGKGAQGPERLREQWFSSYGHDMCKVCVVRDSAKSHLPSPTRTCFTTSVLERLGVLSQPAPAPRIVEPGAPGPHYRPLDSRNRALPFPDARVAFLASSLRVHPPPTHARRLKSQAAPVTSAFPSR